MLSGQAGHKIHAFAKGNAKAEDLERKKKEEFDRWTKGIKRNPDGLEYEMRLLKLDQEYASAIENKNEYIRLKIKEGELYKSLNKVYQSNINKIKAKMKTVSKSSDEYYELNDMLQQYTQSMKQNEIAIVENNKVLKDYSKELRDGVISAQELVMDAVKARAKAEYEANQKIIRDKIDFLNKEKQLLSDAYNARKQEQEEQKKQERLAELEKRYNKLKLDNSGMFENEKLNLSKEIESLKEEIYEDSLAKEQQRQEEAIDKEIEKYENELQMLQDHYSQMEESMQEYWLEVDNIMKGSQESIIEFLKANSDEYKKAGKLQREAFLEGWGDTINFAKQVMDGKLKSPEQIKKETPKPTPPPKPSTSGGGSSSSTKTPKVGGKVKVSGSNAKAYMDSYGKNVRPWADQAKAAGVGYGASLYLVNQRNGYGALSKTNNINGAIAWVKMSDLQAFKTGGLTGDNEGIAYLHDNEMVLNKKDTSNYKDLTNIIDKFLDVMPSLTMPSLSKNLALASGKDSSPSYSFGDIIVEVEKLDSDTDFDKLTNKLKDSFVNSIKGLGGQFSVPKLR